MELTRELSVEARSLREDLLAIDGVEHAEVDGAATTPSGLRIRVSQEADQKLVGESIRRVLSAHGLGTDTTLPGEPDSGQPSSSQTAVSDTEDMATVSELAAQSTTSVATLEAVDGDPSVDDGAGYEPLVTPRAAGAESGTPELRRPARVTIDRVSVEEGRGGIVVTVVSSDGHSETELARTTDNGVERAVVLAAARLAAPGAPDPVVIEVDERRIEGVDIVMIVLDDNGVVKAGSAVIGAGQAFALGRATWAAMLN